MRAQSQVLICEDHAPTARALEATARRYQLVPKSFSSSADCYNWLEVQKLEPHPLWAVMDLDMRLAKEQNPNSYDCLRLLNKDYSDVSVMVYSGALNQASERGAVVRSHPKAWMHDKNDGPDELFNRINHMMSKEIGELTLSQGYCLHKATGKVFDHQAAIRLLINYPGPCHVYNAAEVRAIQRFRQWLRENDKNLAVVSHGNQTYSLLLTNDSGDKS